MVEAGDERYAKSTGALGGSCRLLDFVERDAAFPVWGTGKYFGI